MFLKTTIAPSFISLMMCRSLFSVFSGSGANILTINQSIPINGIALVTISVETAGMQITSEELLHELQGTGGVKKVEVIAG